MATTARHLYLQVIHRVGKRHTNADALSRNPCRACRRQEELNQTECGHTNEENNTVEECTSENERTEAKMQNPGEHQSRNQIENKISDTNIRDTSHVENISRIQK